MMYSRGQFAIMGRVGRKALRLYHEEGLLVPSYTNGENGYNYYSDEQMETLERIKKLRKIGLSLYEIKQILDGKADETKLVKSRIREMKEDLKAVKELARGESEEEKLGDGEVPDIKGFEKKTCLYIDENVEKEDLGISIGKLYEKAAREGLNAKGSHFVIYEGLSDDEDFSMRTCLPVADYEGNDAISVREEKCLHLNFKGGFSKSGEAHKIIKHYAEENKIILADKVLEVYNRDMSVDVYYPIS
jgi:DNA-binding transcriptional MerR regulator